VANLPQVSDLGHLAAFAVTQPADVELLAPLDNKVGESFWTKKIIAGRLPDPAKSDETIVSFALAQARRLTVGDRLTMHVASPASAGGAPAEVSLRIVGVDAAATEFPPQSGTGIHAAWA